jgi:N-acyl-D-amino-acid deacylase
LLITSKRYTICIQRVRDRMSGTLLKNGYLIDGTGTPARLGSLLISGDIIEDMGDIVVPSDVTCYDCSGLTITPGFIDAHSHSDLQVLEKRTEKSRQGVTAEVVGNCGFSAYPASPDPSALRSFANGIFCGDDTWGWASTTEYLNSLAQSPMATVGSLTGHGSLRIAVAGNRLGVLPDHDIERMEGLLDEALSAGAIGLSTGLMYAPGSTAPFEELERLCRVVARRGKIYASHIRSYFADLPQAIEEQIQLARRTGCRLQISHLQAVGAKNWHLHQQALDLIEAAKQEGIDIAFDCYPYIAGSTVLTQLLPDWSLEGGLPGLMQRLMNASERDRIVSETADTLAWEWRDIYISSVQNPADRPTIGKNLQELSEIRGIPPVRVVLQLLADNEGSVNMVSFNQSEDNLRKSLQHPLSLIITDGFYVRGRPHPRLSGTFPLLLGTFVREKRWLTLEDAVRKITGFPAERFGFSNRGVLKPGYAADITVFDAEKIASPASYDRPQEPPVGIRWVFRNGEVLEGAVQCV